MGANAQIAVPAFTAGQVLTAAQQTQINTGIPVFATTTTRDAAFGGAGEKTLAEGQFAYLEDTNTTQYYDGASWQSLSATRQIAIFNETQAQGTLGGTSVAATFTKRTLNTSVYNTITGCSIASSVITLPAGTFYIEGSSPVFKANRTKMKLRNTTAGTDAIIGMSMYTNVTGDPAVINPMFSGTVVTTASTTFEMQYYTQAAYASEGLGVGNNIASTAEVYGTIYIEKIA